MKVFVFLSPKISPEIKLDTPLLLECLVSPSALFCVIIADFQRKLRNRKERNNLASDGVARPIVILATAPHVRMQSQIGKKSLYFPLKNYDIMEE